MRDGRLAARASRWGVALAAACLAGCALDWSFQVPGKGGGDGGGSSSGASSSGSTGTSDGSTPADAGPTCGANADCPLGTVCHFSDHLCGRGQPGHCRVPRTPCSSAPSVCACDGIVDADECAANGRGQDTSSDATCTPPGFRYRCGPIFCITGTPFSEFCVRHTGTGEQAYACQNAFDFSCSEVSCAPTAKCDPHGCACNPIAGGARLDCP